jgi:hypothetical protein
MVTIESAMREMFLGEIEETFAVLKAQLAAAGFNEAPEVIRKTNYPTSQCGSGFHAGEPLVTCVFPISNYLETLHWICADISGPPILNSFGNLNTETGGKAVEKLFFQLSRRYSSRRFSFFL